MRARGVVGLAIAVVVLATGACGGDDDDSAAGGSDAEIMPAASECNADGTVDAGADSEAVVELGEWLVDAPAGGIDAGNVKLVANNGGGETHELVIVRGVSEDELTVVDGKVDEEALPEGAFIGEIEEFAARSSCEAIFPLEAGSYVLFCNIVETEDDGAVDSHFSKGMVTTVEVS